MQYRGKEYSIVQGIKPGTWKWTVRLDENNVRTGIDKRRSAAMHLEWTDYSQMLAPRPSSATAVVGANPAARQTRLNSPAFPRRFGGESDTRFLRGSSSAHQ